MTSLPAVSGRTGPFPCAKPAKPPAPIVTPGEIGQACPARRVGKCNGRSNTAGTEPVVKKSGSEVGPAIWGFVVPDVEMGSAASEVAILGLERSVIGSVWPVAEVDLSEVELSEESTVTVADDVHPDIVTTSAVAPNPNHRAGLCPPPIRQGYAEIGAPTEIRGRLDRVRRHKPDVVPQFSFGASREAVAAGTCRRDDPEVRKPAAEARSGTTVTCDARRKIPVRIAAPSPAHSQRTRAATAR